MDDRGKAVLRLGEEMVPHGQEVRVARFLASSSEPQMVLRFEGHAPEVMVVDVDGEVRRRLGINSSPNNTGLEVVYWNGAEERGMLYNGGMLWDMEKETGQVLPGLPPPIGPPRMGWYHCVPADLCGDEREELLLYNPWDRFIYVYTPEPFGEGEYAGYRPGARQYNARLMD